MKKSRFTEEQMVRIVRESDGGGVPVTAKKHGISEQTLVSVRSAHVDVGYAATCGSAS